MRTFPTIVRPTNRLLVFARVPEKGLVKTRLAETLGEDRALEAYEAMLSDLFFRIGSSNQDLEIEILWTASDRLPGQQILEAFGDYHLCRQTGRDLGERLVMAFSERVVFQKASKIIAIGTDLPALDRRTVETALGLLESCEWVAGPAEDGGYYLIGCRAASFHPEVFNNIEWGSESVFESTEARIRDIGASLALLPVRSDIDHEDDLILFGRNPESEGTQTRRILREWGLT